MLIYNHNCQTMINFNGEGSPRTLRQGAHNTHMKLDNIFSDLQVHVYTNYLLRKSQVIIPISEFYTEQETGSGNIVIYIVSNNN